MFDQGRAAFYPVTIIAVGDAVDFANFRVMDMAANNAVDAPILGNVGKRIFKVCNKFNGVFHLQLQIGGKRPVWISKPLANGVESIVELEAEPVTPVAEVGKPAGVFDDDIEFIAMQNQKLPAICGGVDDFMNDLNGAKIMVDIVSSEFIMVSRNKDNPGPLPRLAHDLLHHVVVSLRPVPALLQAPSVDNIANEVEVFALGASQKIQQEVCLAPGGA